MLSLDGFAECMRAGFFFNFSYVLLPFRPSSSFWFKYDVFYKTFEGRGDCVVEESNEYIYIWERKAAS